MMVVTMKDSKILSLLSFFVPGCFLQTLGEFHPTFSNHEVQQRENGSSIQRDSFLDNLVANMTIPELGENFSSFSQTPPILRCFV
jgi:hypothetical protein